MADPNEIVVVSDEELYFAFMQSFSPQTHHVYHATSIAEATGVCPDSPALMVVSVDQPSAELAQLLSSCRLHDVRVLGLYRQVDAPDQPVDMLAPADSRKLVYRAAAELLNERRSHPRVRLQLPVDMEGVGRAYCSTVSAVSMFVETEAMLETGAQVAIRIPHGPGISGEAMVVRSGLGESGNVGMVLSVSGEAISAFLRDQVRDALKAYYEQMQGQVPQAQVPQAQALTTPQPLLQAQPAQVLQPEPNYQELSVSGLSGDEEDDDFDYDEPATNVTAFPPVASGEEVNALQARIEKQQKIIEKVVLRLRKLDKGRESAEQGGAAEALQQLATLGGRIDSMEHEREPLQAGLFGTGERVAELERRVDALAQDDSADRLSDLRETVDTLGARVDSVEGGAASRDAVDAGHHELTERVDQLAYQLEQAQEKAALDLEQGLERERASLQTTFEEAGERVAEQAQRLEQLAEERASRESVTELEEQLVSRLTEVEALAGAAATPEALQSSAEALTLLLEQLRESVEQVEAKALEAQQEATQERDLQAQAQQQAAEELEQRVQTELEQVSQAQQQTAEGLEQRLQTELEELEQRAQAGQTPLQTGLDEASQRLVELAGRIDELAGETLAELQEQQRLAERRLSKVEGVASDAATQDALESSGEALLHRAEQLAQRVEQAEGTLRRVTEDLEQAQEKAQLQEQAQGDAVQEVEERLEGRLGELLTRLDELGSATPNEKVLAEREEALTRRIEAQIDSRLKQAARESAAQVKETVSREIATAMASFEEIRTEILDILEDVIKQQGEAQAQLDEQAKVLSRVVHRLDRMQRP